MENKRDKMDDLIKDHFKSEAAKRPGIRKPDLSKHSGANGVGEMHPNIVKLGEYIDGSLEKTVRFKIKEHLLNCKRCQREVSEIKSVVEEFENDKSPDDPKMFTPEEILSFTKKSPRPRAK
ncbi:MAG: zf-HC2 domain-containing protein [Candidatus Omnitrophota bacterium]